VVSAGDGVAAEAVGAASDGIVVCGSRAMAAVVAAAVWRKSRRERGDADCGLRSAECGFVVVMVAVGGRKVASSE